MTFSRRLTSAIALGFLALAGCSQKSEPPRVIPIHLPQTEAPKLSPAAGTYAADQLVRIEGGTPDARIYYTLDGSEPTTSSQRYSGPIAVRGNASRLAIRAIAEGAGRSPSVSVSGVYVIEYGRAAAPTFAPEGGLYSSDQSVVLSSTTAGAEIHYTLDGSEPTLESPRYEAPIRVSGHRTLVLLRAMAVAPGTLPSELTSREYTVIYQPAEAPVASPEAGTFFTDQEITLQSPTPGARIFFTLDGSEPTIESTLYTGSIIAMGHGTQLHLRAITVKEGMLPSAALDGAWAIHYPPAEAPVMSPEGGVFSTDQTVTLSSATADAAIFYTTDGSEPTTASMQYTGPIVVAGHGTTAVIKALAAHDGMLPSAASSTTYSIVYERVAVPTISPSGGDFTSPQQVTIATATPGAVLHYTLDGSTPSVASPTYNGPFTVSSTKTVRAIAVKAGMLDSEVGSATVKVVRYLYVATNGSDGSDGSAAAPFATVTRALAETDAGGSFEIRVAAGTYASASTLTVRAGVALMGGYEAQGWTRDISANVTQLVDTGSASGVAVLVSAGDERTLVEGFTIVTFLTINDTTAVRVEQGNPTIRRNIMRVDGTGNGQHIGVYSVAASPRIIANDIRVVRTRYAFGMYVTAGSPFIFSNVIDTSDGAINFNYGISFENGANPTISSNTIRFGDADTSRGIGSFRIVPNTPMNATIENNIIFGKPLYYVGSTCLDTSAAGTGTVSVKNNNLFDCDLLAQGQGTGCSTADQLNALPGNGGNLAFDMTTGANTYFVNEANDYRLQNGGVGTFLTVKTGALSVGAAATSFGVVTDVTGATRTAIDTIGWSMGAYENDL